MALRARPELAVDGLGLGQRLVQDTSSTERVWQLQSDVLLYKFCATQECEHEALGLPELAVLAGSGCTTWPDRGGSSSGPSCQECA